ncbi:MAG TPA: hypothetical protein VFX80_02385 [Solirubrobacteraceae bacterium]|nr:hypothetical protein [Solirubrobacteraceae bacterium]
MLIINGTYEKLRQSSVSSVFYMEITEGRNDNFELYATMAGGAVMHVTVPARPADFDADFPNAIEVDAFQVT